MGSTCLLNTLVLPQFASSCDHYVISFSVQVYIESNLHKSTTFPDFNLGNYAEIIEYLHSVNWEVLCSQHSNNLQDLYDKFLEILHSSINQFIPFKVKIKTHSKKIKIPVYIRNLQQQKLKIYKIQIR